MRPRAVIIALLLAAAAYIAAARIPWCNQPDVRRATGIVLATLILWISEIAPLGIIALAIPIAATFAKLLTWESAVSVWGDRIIFLNLGAFLLARALDKHGAFDWLLSARWWGSNDPAAPARHTHRPAGRLTALVLTTSGTISTVQNNTATTAMLLPVVAAAARRASRPAPVLMALSLGATLGGMSTPIGTAPNFIGYGAMKKLDDSISFLSWARVGIPVWIGASIMAWLILMLASRWNRLLSPPAPDPQPGAGWAEPRVTPDIAPSIARQDESRAQRIAARRWALAALAAAAAAWIATGIVVGTTPTGHRAREIVETYLPESLVPVAVALALFIVRVGPAHRPVLDRHDFQLIDWDTIFLFAGGLCLGKMLEQSGAATALANSVAHAHLPPLALLLLLAAATVLLSELTSNTATAALMVPIAASLAPVVGMSPVKVIWVVALSASLGFALPVSTPPNALVYGTRLVPLRWMAVVGIMIDVVCLLWVVACVTLLG